MLQNAQVGVGGIELGTALAAHDRDGPPLRMQRNG
jgi:hypothetical protein